MVIPPHGQTRSGERKKITVQYVGEVKESTAVLTGSIKRKKKFPLSFSLKKCNIIDENSKDFIFAMISQSREICS